MRPPANDSVFIKRLLDSGFSNFLVPFVDSADDAARAVAATRYPPQGIRGVSVSHRGNRYATVPDYFDVANDNVCVIVQIESRKAVDAIDEILAVDGVDAVFVGPSDLAAAYGHLGNPNHPDVQQAIARVFERAQAAGKPSGILAPGAGRRGALYLDGLPRHRGLRGYGAAESRRADGSKTLHAETGGPAITRPP